MDCLYLDGEVCRAKPSNASNYFKPDAQALKAYCNNEAQMKLCPRATVYHEYLKSKSKE